MYHAAVYLLGGEVGAGCRLVTDNPAGTQPEQLGRTDLNNKAAGVEVIIFKSPSPVSGPDVDPVWPPACPAARRSSGCAGGRGGGRG